MIFWPLVWENVQLFCAAVRPAACWLDLESSPRSQRRSQQQAAMHGMAAIMHGSHAACRPPRCRSLGAQQPGENRAPPRSNQRRYLSFTRRPPRPPPFREMPPSRAGTLPTPRCRQGGHERLAWRLPVMPARHSTWRGALAATRSVTTTRPRRAAQAAGGVPRRWTACGLYCAATLSLLISCGATAAAPATMPHQQQQQPQNHYPHRQSSLLPLAGTNDITGPIAAGGHRGRVQPGTATSQEQRGAGQPAEVGVALHLTT
eukprot:COSAG01_NODE_10646_length_2113_cov_2.138034_3_plen_259_part_01